MGNHFGEKPKIVADRVIRWKIFVDVITQFNIHFARVETPGDGSHLKHGHFVINNSVYLSDFT